MIKIIEKIYLLDFSIIFQNIYKNCGKKLNYNKKKMLSLQIRPLVEKRELEQGHQRC